MTGLAGTTQLLRLALRRDRLALPLWVYGLVVITYVSGKGVATTFPTQPSIDAYAAAVGSSPAAIALSGPPIALHTLAGIVLNKVSFVAVVGVSLMAILLVVRHTRAEEDAGRTELLGASVVGRYAGPAAALLTALGASLVVGAGTALALLVCRVPAAGAWVFGAEVTALGAVFATGTLCLAQLLGSARAATGTGLVLLGAAYVLRAVGDIRGDAVVWASPIGWAQATHPLGGDRWWPLLVPVVVSLLLSGLAGLLVGRRDVGAGLLPARRGPAAAGRTLRGPVGLAWRLERGAVLAWGAGLFVVALVVGSLTDQIEQMARQNPILGRYLHSPAPGAVVEAFFGTMLLILALTAAAFAVSSALHLRSEESSRRLEPMLAAPLSRQWWMLGRLLVTAVAAAALLALSGLGVGLSYGAATGDPGQALRMAGLALVYLPAVLVLPALVALLHGWVPGWARSAWAVLAFCFVLGWLGGLLNPPDWLSGLSPFQHTPEVPGEPVAVAPLLAIGASVVLLAGAGLLGFRRRDVG